ncbi:MAG: hypothetical protein V1660_01145 [archaeon]
MRDKICREPGRTRATLNFLGILFLITGILQFIVPWLDGNYTHFIWFSSHVIILLGVGILLRSRFLLTAELCIALIPETLWSIDFLGKLFSNKYFIGITQYMFEGKFDFVALVNLEHLLIIPLGLVAVWYLGRDKNGWKGSLIHVLVLWVIGLIAGPIYNINCIFKSCTLLFGNLSSYMILWPIIVFSMICLSNVILELFSLMKK